jgi:hypothetical protein
MKETDTHSPPETEVIERGHEADSISPRLLILSTLGLVSLMAFALLVANLARRGLSPEVETGRAQRIRSAEPRTGVRVTADQPGQLAELRESEDRRLTRYEWIVEPEGIARIPIQRAMELIAENGLPKPRATTEEQNENAD